MSLFAISAIAMNGMGANHVCRVPSVSCYRSVRLVVRRTLGTGLD